MHQISTKVYLWTIYQTVKQKTINKDGELVGSFDFKEFSEKAIKLGKQIFYLTLAIKKEAFTSLFKYKHNLHCFQRDGEVLVNPLVINFQVVCHPFFDIALKR